jgi:transcriptional regulator with XRE-family HTH domain
MKNLIAKVPDPASDTSWFGSLQVEHIHRLKLEFATKVSLEMDKAGISRKELAERVGTSAAWISTVLRGDANPTLETMQKLASAIGCDVHVHIAPQSAVCIWSEVHPAREAPRSLIPSTESVSPEYRLGVLSPTRIPVDRIPVMGSSGKNFFLEASNG